ncbi:hypothetical protein GWI33_020020 [Rhynchophorus ferrugineus]|uniref:Uncharacterized protein n=1 Tax=Rhynchophorus ferrugineus TaxID=354439 RepID=A0A834HSE4_RHYFE|nr:hypothetical protein GWI33_020020 [Rhynchophorus ferrugineus]
MEKKTGNTNQPNVFERLYSRRHVPNNNTVNSVRRQYEERRQSIANRRESITNPPPHQQTRRRSSTAAHPNVSVFERLYSQRRQLGHKRLTDTEKRNLHIERQREEIRRARATSITRRRRSRSSSFDNDSPISSESNNEILTSDETPTLSRESSFGDFVCRIPMNVCVKEKKNALNSEIKRIQDTVRHQKETGILCH